MVSDLVSLRGPCSISGHVQGLAAEMRLEQQADFRAGCGLGDTDWWLEPQVRMTI